MPTTCLSWVTKSRWMRPAIMARAIFGTGSSSGTV
jgi:hypothetical protein